MNGPADFTRGLSPTRGTSPALRLERVSKRFGSVIAVDNLSLEVKEGEFFSLLGSSGCGKSTTLRMMAGFEEPDAGSIYLRGEDVTFVEPNRRNVNMVFQAYELFPHMTVFDNVGYGLRLRKVPLLERADRVRAMLAVVRVEGLERRGARELSGGQQQRVALARALVNRPAVLLLDEPLSALDVKLRKQMQHELKQIQHQLGTTFVYVTHDQEEALLMSDRIGIMDAGHLLQVGTPREIYERPSHRFVADFVGTLNALEIRIDEVTDGFMVMHPSPDEQVVLRLPPTAVAGAAVSFAIRPERIRIDLDNAGATRPPNSMTTWLHGTVAVVYYLGTSTQYRVTTSAVGEIVCHHSNHTTAPDLQAGDPVIVSWSADAGFSLPNG